MEKKTDNEKKGKKKSFFSGLIEKLDKKIQEKARSSGGCCGPSDKEGGSCCS